MRVASPFRKLALGRGPHPANSGIWRVDKNDGTIELLVNAPSSSLLTGIDAHRGFLYAADTTAGLVWRVPVTGGHLEIWADDPLLKPPPGAAAPGPNGLRVYCTTDPTNTLVRLDPDGTNEILLAAADGLDGPTSATFGRRGRNRKNLYITNAAFPFYTTTFRPSLMRLRLRIPGAPN